MPARRNPKKTRTPRTTPLGVDPAVGNGPLPPTRPALDLAVEPALPTVLVEPALPAVFGEPALPAAVLDEVPPPVDVAGSSRRAVACRRCRR